nr:protein NLP7-like [Ipomoea batatas]
MKRACRDFGINRWPNHKGKRPNCSLNQKQDVQAVKKHKGIQPCPALPPLQATNTSQCNSTIMSVKVIYKNDTLRFPLSSSSTIKYLEEQLETKLKIPLENFSIKYQDEEDEWITLTCDSELMHGLDVLRSCGKTVIRLMVTPKFD